MLIVGTSMVTELTVERWSSVALLIVRVSIWRTIRCIMLGPNIFMWDFKRSESCWRPYVLLQKVYISENTIDMLTKSSPVTSSNTICTGYMFSRDKHNVYFPIFRINRYVGSLHRVWYSSRWILLSISHILEIIMSYRVR